MAYAAGTLVLNASAAPGNAVYFHDAVADTMATVMTAGYFNNTDDDLNLAVDDVIFSICSDGDIWARVSALSSGSVTCQTVGGWGPNNGDVSTATSGTQIAVGVNEIGTGTCTAWTTATPYPGARLTISLSGTSTGTITVSSSGVTNNAKGDTTVIFSGVAGGSLDLLGVSTTQWVILSSSLATLG